jgi:ribosome-binding factor A
MSYKQDRTAEDIKREICAVMKQVKDPRVSGHFLTVVRIELSSDASYAKIYISDMQGIDSAKLAVKGLESASGYIRHEMGKELHLRKAPELKFIADDSVRSGIELIKKIDDLTGE